jgi:2-iminobutanoate/2-iminopropanoate deaminase
MPLSPISTPNAPAAVGPYSQGIIANGFLFTAGQVAIDPATGTLSAGDVATQTDLVLRNLQGIITAAGATWNDVVKTTVFLKDLSTFSTVNEVYARCLGTARPARSTVQVAALPLGALVEIEAVVALPQ